MKIDSLTDDLARRLNNKPKVPSEAFSTQFLDQKLTKMQQQNAQSNSQFTTNPDTPDVKVETLPKNLPKTADVYSFDDLLVACAHEIIIHGMDTNIVPESIKDWVAGKLVRAMPKQLCQRLLNFMIEMRDFESTLGFKETRHGDVPEFTLLMYRNAKSKMKKEAEQARNFNADLDKPAGSMFEDDRNVTKEGSKFFSDELMVDATQTVPIIEVGHMVKKAGLFSKLAGKNAKNKGGALEKKLTPYDVDDSYIDQVLSSDDGMPPPPMNDSDDEMGRLQFTGTEDDTQTEDDEISDKPKKKRKRKVPGRKPGRPRLNDMEGEGSHKCHVDDCDAKFRTKSQLSKHYKYKHPDIINPHAASFVKLQEEAKMLKGFPEIFHDEENGYICTLCGHSTVRLQRCARHVAEVHRKDRGFNCEICGKTFSRGSSLKRHMMLHTGNLHSCQYCGKQFGQLWDLEHIHKRKYHPDEYTREQQEREQLKALKSMTKPVDFDRIKRRLEKREDLQRGQGFIGVGSNLPTLQEEYTKNESQLVGQALSQTHMSHRAQHNQGFSGAVL